MTATQQSVAERTAPASLFERTLAFLASSITMRLMLALAIVVIVALVARASLVIAALVLIASGLYIRKYNPEARFLASLRKVLIAAAPVLALFLLASLVTIPTAFDPARHVTQIPKIFALQIAIVICFVVGTLLRDIPLRKLMWWSFAILAAATVLLLEEQQWYLLRTALLPGNPFAPENYAILNRSFLFMTLGLVFFLCAGRGAKSWLFAIGALVLTASIWVATFSESARLVMILAVAVFLLNGWQLQRLTAIAVIGAVVLMAAGPFLYDDILAAWQTGPWNDFQIGTFRTRLEIYADFGALIRDSSFLGRGLNVSKILAADPSWFTMPNHPCVAGAAFCAWHPHNAGLEIVTDLGFLGIAWFGLAIWKVRGLVLTLSPWQQNGVFAVLIGFLAVSFIADGAWQSWWWLTAAIIALWIGILSVNKDAVHRAVSR